MAMISRVDRRWTARYAPSRNGCGWLPYLDLPMLLCADVSEESFGCSLVEIHIALLVLCLCFPIT